MSMINLEKKIYFGGSIVTINEKQPFVEAVGIEGEKIVSIGDLEGVKKALGNRSTLIDLKGHSLLPGFIDCHLHPIIYIFYLLSPDVSDVKSIEELKKYLGKASKGRNKDELMMVFNLCEEKFDVPKLPNKGELDEACPDHPVFVMRYDGHIGIANTKALELAKIDEHTIVPEGGEIRKDSSGNLTGVISEQALDIILAKMSFPNVEKIKEAAVKAFRNFAQKGLTSLHGILSADSTGEFGDAGAMELPLRKSIQNSILQNWYALINTEKPKKLLKLRKPPLDGGKEDLRWWKGR
jgi:predicted amidohydrolase YtcJ